MAFADRAEDPESSKQRRDVGGTSLHHGACRGHERRDPESEQWSCELAGAHSSLPLLRRLHVRASIIAARFSGPRVICGRSNPKMVAFTAPHMVCCAPVNR